MMAKRWLFMAVIVFTAWHFFYFVHIYSLSVGVVVLLSSWTGNSFMPQTNCVYFHSSSFYCALHRYSAIDLCFFFFFTSRLVKIQFSWIFNLNRLWCDFSRTQFAFHNVRTSFFFFGKPTKLMLILYHSHYAIYRSI